MSRVCRCVRFTVKATSAELVATMDARGRKYKGSWEARHQEPFARGSLPDGPYKFASYPNYG